MQQPIIVTAEGWKFLEEVILMTTEQNQLERIRAAISGIRNAERNDNSDAVDQFTRGYHYGSTNERNMILGIIEDILKGDN